jgi:hypothetical protein
MITQTDKDQQPSGKGESTYPLYALPEALRFADAVSSLGGSRSEVDRSMIASQLGIDERSVNLSQRMGAAKCYGMIVGRGSYSLTRLANQYFLPTNDSDRRQALLGFLSSPKAFMVLIKRFDGSKLPSVGMLGNILHKEANVPVSWKDRVAQMFLKSARFAEAIDSGDFLRFRAALQGLQSKSEPPPSNQDQPTSIPEPLINTVSAPPSDSRPASQPSALGGSNLWNYSFEGMCVRLETPKDLKFGLWEKLNGYVQLLKPSSEEGK